MSDTEQMVRLMRHASDVLDSSLDALDVALRRAPNDEVAGLTKVVAAAAMACGVLDMVAASVAPEGDAVVQRLIDGFRNLRYDKWADEKSYAALTHAEQLAVRVYLRELLHAGKDGS